MFMTLEGGGLCCHFQDILDILKITTVTPHLLSSSHTVLVFEKKKKMFYFLRVKVFIQENCPTDVYEVGGGDSVVISRYLRYLENYNSDPPLSIIKPYSVSF